jgi:hypothetical protein
MPDSVLSFQDRTFVDASGTAHSGHLSEPICALNSETNSEGSLRMTSELDLRVLLTGMKPEMMMTLTVHSSLEAVGFLAAITARLAEAGISVNAISAFCHDHLFVPEDRADEALARLEMRTLPI